MATEIYKRALANAENAWADYKSTCSSLQEGGVTDQQTNQSLNHLIAMCWQLKEAAVEKEPAPIPPRRATRGKSNA